MESETYLDTPIWYEDNKISFFILRNATFKYLKVPMITPIENTTLEFEKAINSPLDAPSLQELVSKHYKQDEYVIILLDDHTRPNIHTKALLPLLTEKLIEYGINRADIRLLIATGTHAPPTPAQIKERILGDLYEEWKDQLWLHDCDDLKNHENLGFSSLGTPILIDKRALASCLIIPLSDSEYHYFAGVAGSVKLFIPGISARQTVRVNHSRIFDLNTGFKKNCRMSIIENNICIQDIRDIVQTLTGKYPIFVIDAIMHKGNFANIFAGSPIVIHNNAQEALSRIRDVKINEKADLVIVAKPSVNFYQLGKGLNAASLAVKEGGIILLLGACSEGIGPDDYLETMKTVKHLPFQEAMQWVIKKKCSKATFEIGIQNAVDLFRILELTDGQVFIYSELDSQLLKEVFRVNSLNTMGESLQEVLRDFVQKFVVKHPNGMIYVFEDFNLLTVSSKLPSETTD